MTVAWENRGQRAILRFVLFTRNVPVKVVPEGVGFEQWRGKRLRHSREVESRDIGRGETLLGLRGLMTSVASVDNRTIGSGLTKPSDSGCPQSLDRPPLRRSLCAAHSRRPLTLLTAPTTIFLIFFQTRCARNPVESQPRPDEVGVVLFSKKLDRLRGVVRPV